MNTNDFQQRVLDAFNNNDTAHSELLVQMARLEEGQRLCPAKASIKWVKAWLAALTLAILGVGTKLLVGFLLGEK